MAATRLVDEESIGRTTRKCTKGSMNREIPQVRNFSASQGIKAHTQCLIHSVLQHEIVTCLQYVEGQNESVNTTCAAHGNAASNTNVVALGGLDAKLGLKKSFLFLDLDRK